MWSVLLKEKCFTVFGIEMKTGKPQANSQTAHEDRLTDRTYSFQPHHVVSGLTVGSQGVRTSESEFISNPIFFSSCDRHIFGKTFKCLILYLLYCGQWMELTNYFFFLRNMGQPKLFFCWSRIIFWQADLPHNVLNSNDLT